MMRNVLIFIFVMLPASFSFGMQMPVPHLDNIFNYESLDDSELDDIFSALAMEFSAPKGDEQKMEELLRNDNKAVLRLRDHLRKSDSFNLLRENMAKFIETLPKEEISKLYIAAASNKLLVFIVSCNGGLEYIVQALKKYEDYVAIFSSEKVAHKKALSFFCLFLVNHVLFGEDPNLRNMAALIQKKALGIEQAKIDTFDLLSQKLERKYIFSKAFRFSFFMAVKKLESQTKNETQIIKEKILLNWLQSTYGLTPHASVQILDRLVLHGLLAKREKKLAEKKKYIIQSTSCLKDIYKTG